MHSRGLTCPLRMAEDERINRIGDSFLARVAALSGLIAVEAAVSPLLRFNSILQRDVFFGTLFMCFKGFTMLF